MKIFRHLAVFLIVVLLTACFAGCTPKVPPPPVESFPVSHEVEQALLESLQATAGAFHSLEGLAQVKVVLQGKSMSGTQVLVAEKPDRLRAETLSPFGFGPPLVLVATDGSDLAVMVPLEGRVYRGKASPKNMMKFTHLPLQVEDLVRILLYQVPLIAHHERVFSAFSAGGYGLVLEGDDVSRQELSFNDAMLLVGSAYYVDGELALRVKYDTFSEGERPFPQVASLEMPGSQAEARLSFSEVRTNVVPDRERFFLTTPPGYTESTIP